MKYNDSNLKLISKAGQSFKIHPQFSRVGFLMLLCFVFIPIVHGIVDCKGVMKQDDIPCLVITSWQSPNECGSYDVKIFDSTPILLDTRLLANYSGTGRCNITFNYTNVDSYLLNFSSGDSAKIIVEDDQMLNIFNLGVFAFFVLLSIIFIFLMHKTSGDNAASSIAYGSFASVFMMIMGGMITSGFVVIKTGISFIFNLNYYLAAICYVLGLYTMIHSVMLYKHSKPVKSEFDVD